MTQPTVSVIIPTLNAGSAFPDILERIHEQKDVSDVEIVVVDSGSTDGTRQAAQHSATKTITIPRRNFNHGGTRNLAILEAHGELIALLTQDAMPDNDQWLYYLVAAVMSDDDVSGAYSRQIPHPDTPPWIKHQMAEHGLFSDQPRIQQLSNPKSFDTLDPLERLNLCIFDDVSSLIRRSTWENHPLPEAPFAEDLEWAKEELLRGKKIVYEPKSRVIHSHRRGAIHEYRRAKIAHYRLYELFDLRLVPTIPLLFRYSLQNIIRLTNWTLQERPVHLNDAFMAPFVAVASTLGQYMGAKIASQQRGAQP